MIIDKGTLEWYGKRVLRALLSVVIRSHRITPEDIEWGTVRKILVVRQHDVLGDAVLTTPALRALKAHVPHAKIHWMVRPPLVPLFAMHPGIDEVIPFEKSRVRRDPSYAWALRRRLKSAAYDVTLVFSGSSFSVTSAVLAYGSGAHIRIGYSGAVFGYEKFAEMFFTTVIPVPPPAECEMEKHVLLLNAVGIPAAEPSHWLGVAPEATDEVAKILKAKGIKSERPLVVLNPGSGKADHRWPVERFAALHDLLREREGINVVVTVGPGEDELEHAVRQAAKRPIQAVLHLKLAPLAGLFRLARVVVCNDTGLLHVAAGVGTPTVGLFGPSDPQWWNPKGDSHMALRALDGQLTSVQVEEVEEAVLRWVR